MEFAHKPVLLKETLALLAPAIKPGEKNLMIDCTLGEGGHSEAFLEKFTDLDVFGIDADKNIIKCAEKRLERFGARVSFFRCWADDFLNCNQLESLREFSPPCIILIDLGVSLYHYEKGGRGFSFQNDEALDMRIDTSRGESVKSLLSHISEKDLADLLYYNAEEQKSRRIARAIIEERSKAPIISSAQLASIVEKACFRQQKQHNRRNQYSGMRIHPATKTFQALRIAVNGELERLPSLLESALSILARGGRLGVISFHSLEDRIVKNFFRDCAHEATGGLNYGSEHAKCENLPIIKSKRVNLITKKPVCAGEEERMGNPPSRSAKLRVVEKL